MSKLKLETAAKQQMPLIKKLYRKAFPQNERKPFYIITRGQKQGTMEIMSINDGNFAGLCITSLYKDRVLLEYFAIDENSRGSGYGSEALALLRERYSGKKFILEIEQPDVDAANNAERVRRKKFYLRNGFSETGITVNLFGVTMELLSYGCELTFDEYYDVYKHILSNFIARKNVKQIISSNERQQKGTIIS